MSDQVALSVQLLNSIRIASVRFTPKDSIELDLHEASFFRIVYGDQKQITPGVIGLMKLLPSHRMDFDRNTHCAHLDDFGRFVSLCDQMHEKIKDINDAFMRRGATERLKAALGARGVRKREIFALHEAKDAPEIMVPGLVDGVELYPFQRVNVKFLMNVESGILADQMGLGKTLSLFCTLQMLYEDGFIERALIVTTAATKYGWQRELQKFFGDQATVIDSNVKAKLECPLNEEWNFRPRHKTCKKCQFIDNCRRTIKTMRPSDIRREQWVRGTQGLYTIANYEQVRADIDVILKLDPGFDAIVGDEIHRLRNGKTKTHVAMCKLGERIQYRFGATGTPVQNRVSDIWAIMEFIEPRMFGLWGAFAQRYALVDAWGGETPMNLDELHLRLKSVMIRHKKEDVIEDLPSKRYLRRDIELSPKQRKYYEQVKAQMLQLGTEDARDKINEAEIIAMTTHLRLTCDSTALIDPDATEVHESTKIDLLDEMLQDELLPTEPKIVIYSTFVKTLRLLQARFENIPWVEITGDVTGNVWISREEADRLTVPIIAERGAQVSVDRRIHAQQRFNIEDEWRIMYLSDAGGEGLNLQSARCMILFNMPFNPARIAQVEDRIHRIGQVHDCTIISLVTLDTIEERVQEILEEKRDLIDQVVDGHSVTQLILSRWRDLI